MILRAFVSYKNKIGAFTFTRVEFRVIFWNNQTALGGRGHGNTWVGLLPKRTSDVPDPFDDPIESAQQLTVLHTPICSLIKLILMMIFLLFLSTESFFLLGPLNMRQWTDFNTSILGGDAGELGFLDYY